jgi:hypothetical protein
MPATAESQIHAVTMAVPALAATPALANCFIRLLLTNALSKLATGFVDPDRLTAMSGFPD